AILFAWQMAHFYAISLYRAKDYAAAKLPVIAVVKGPAVTRVWIMVYILLFGVACGLLASGGYTGMIFAIVMMLAALLWLTRGVSLRTSNFAVWGRQMFGTSLI